jgi:hypothetical protein
MNILVFMSDNRILDKEVNSAQYNSLTAYINKAYCNKHGYDFMYIHPYFISPDAHTVHVCKDKSGNWRHASWAKLLAAQYCFNMKKYDYVVYIDSDCIFKDFSVSLESVIMDPIYANVNIIYALSLPWHKLPCAGFFIVKVNEETKSFFESWYNYEMPTYHSVEWGNTLTMAKKYISYDWNPGTHWEQDALWCMIANGSSIPYMYIDEMSLLEDNTQFLRHVCSVHAHERLPYFRSVVDTLVTTHGAYKSILETINVLDFDTSVYVPPFL